MTTLVVSAHSFETRAVAGGLPNCKKRLGFAVYESGPFLLATIGEGQRNIEKNLPPLLGGCSLAILFGCAGALVDNLFLGQIVVARPADQKGFYG